MLRPLKRVVGLIDSSIEHVQRRKLQKLKKEIEKTYELYDAETDEDARRAILDKAAELFERRRLLEHGLNAGRNQHSTYS